MPSSPSKIALDGLTFDDVLLLPGHVAFRRSEADLSVKIGRLSLSLPVLSSPMDTVTEERMAIAVAKAGGLGIIHRSLSVQDQVAKVKAVKKEGCIVGAAVGAGADLEERIEALLKTGVDAIVVDSGHGHSQFILDAIKLCKKKSKTVTVIGGNIATAEGAKAVIAAGADAVRIGVGPGSICTTRVVTGVGVPQLTAILEAVKGAKGKKVALIADGGIKQMGDMAKALAAGAHAVMLGGMLAGHDEAPGETITLEGQTFKKYRGMGSIGAMKKGGAERYGQSRDTEAKKLIAEGVEGLVPSKGGVADFLYQAKGALQSSFYYVGAKTLADFHRKSRFSRITPAGLKESHPHTLTKITDVGGAYMVN